jgi:hypothetical protein
VQAGVLPLSVLQNGTVRFATSRPPSGETHERLEGRFKARISFGFCGDGELDLARQRAYRRLLEHVDGAARAQPLGEQLVAARLLTRAALDAALLRHDASVEPLGEYLVRQKLVDPRRLSRFLEARLQETYRPLQPSDGDPVAVRRLGYGFCSLHGLLPLRAAEDGAVRLAAAYPLHDQVAALVMARLGVAVQPVLSPGLDVRVALSIAAQRAWPEGIAAGVGGLDGAELAALASLPGPTFDLGALYGEALAAGRSPVDQLQAEGRLDPETAARILGQVLGVTLTPAAHVPPEATTGWLPAGFDAQGEIAMLEASASSIVLASHRPSPSLAARLVQILPETAIAWRVLVGERPGAPARAPSHADASPPPPPPAR